MLVWNEAIYYRLQSHWEEDVSHTDVGSYSQLTSTPYAHFTQCYHPKNMKMQPFSLGVTTSRAAERIGGAQGKYQMWGAIIKIVRGGSGGMPPENFESLHALKSVRGASEAPFCACIQYIHWRLRLAGRTVP